MTLTQIDHAQIRTAQVLRRLKEYRKVHPATITGIAELAHINRRALYNALEGSYKTLTATDRDNLDIFLTERNF